MSIQFTETIQVIQPDLPPAASPSEVLPAQTPGQPAAVDAAFADLAAPEQENAGLLGALAAGLVLHDVMQDTFASRPDEEEETERERMKNKRAV